MKSKSERAILNAFLEMRASMPLEKISVTALCAKADVNKSTFYAYYHNVYDLSEQLQKEVIDRIASTLPLNESMHDLTRFSKEILMSYEANKTMIQTLFSGAQSSYLPKLVKEKVLTYFRTENTGLSEEELQTVVNFKIYGAYYAFIEETDMNEMDKIELISQLAGARLKKDC
jgi:AcrR family transcriptional regulator